MPLRSTAGSGKVPRDPVHHPLFARSYARLSVAAETGIGLAPCGSGCSPGSPGG
jgi:hypothetical protein